LSQAPEQPYQQYIKSSFSKFCFGRKLNEKKLSLKSKILRNWLQWIVDMAALKGVAAMWQIGLFFRSDLLKKKM
jgi:hypothetical protein